MGNELITAPRAGLEIATSGDGRDITRPYTGSLLVAADRVLSQRGAGDLLIYEQVLSDPQVKSCFEQRRNAVTSCEWQVDAASDRRIDKKAAEWAEKQIKAIGFDNLTDKMLYSVFYGYAVAEIIYEAKEGLLGWSAIKVRNRRRFRFKPDGELRMLTVQNSLDGEPCEKPYFWHVATGADHDDEPYGIGLGHWCYWPTLFKRNGIAFWLSFLEKFATPTAKGTYPVNATADEKGRLLAALSAIRTDSAVIFPEGMTAELLEAARSGTADYKVLHDTMDDSIAKAIIGQTASTQGTPGRLGDDQLQSDVRDDIVKADADLVCESFNLGPLRWLTMFNFPGAEPPRVFRRVEEPEDSGTIAERDTKIKAMGFRPGLAYIRETYGDHWEETTPPDTAPPQTPPAAFADPDAIAAAKAAAQERLDAVVAGADQASAQWREFVGPRVQELQVLLDQSDDLVAFRDRIVELADADPQSVFVEAIARAGFGAQLLGRLPKG